MRYITGEELMKDAKPCNIDEEVRKEFEEERRDPEYYLRKEAEWAEKQAAIASIMHKVVGAEGDD
jgi:hypothetical protein